MSTSTWRGPGGSLLTRQTDSLAEVGRVLAEAHREARDVVNKATLAKLQKVASAVQERAGQLGVKPPGPFHPVSRAVTTREAPPRYGHHHRLAYFVTMI